MERDAVGVWQVCERNAKGSCSEGTLSSVRADLTCAHGMVPWRSSSMGGREFADGTDERPSLPGRCGGPPTMETMPATGGTVDLRDKLSDTNDAAVETGSGEFEAEIEKHEISRGPEERWD